MKNICIINGPNLNLLGLREPEIYGTLTLEEIKVHTENFFKGTDLNLEWFQSNVEGEIVDKIQQIFTSGKYSALIINPAGYTHTSVAIYDALMLLKIPVIEVHLSNTYKREDFRAKKLTSKAAQIIIQGSGKNSYILGIQSQII